MGELCYLPLPQASSVDSGPSNKLSWGAGNHGQSSIIEHATDGRGADALPCSPLLSSDLPSVPSSDCRGHQWHGPQGGSASGEREWRETNRRTSAASSQCFLYIITSSSSTTAQGGRHIPYFTKEEAPWSSARSGGIFLLLFPLLFLLSLAHCSLRFKFSLIQVCSPLPSKCP